MTFNDFFNAIKNIDCCFLHSTIIGNWYKYLFESPIKTLILVVNGITYEFSNIIFDKYSDTLERDVDSIIKRIRIPKDLSREVRQFYLSNDGNSIVVRLEDNVESMFKIQLIDLRSC